MNTGFFGIVFRSLSNHLALSHDSLLSAMGLAYFRRLAASMVDDSFQDQGPNRWTQFLLRISPPIVAHPQDQQTAEVSSENGWQARWRRRRATVRTQLIIALTVVLVGCLYLPRRFTAPVVSQGFRPAPVPVPAPASAIVLQLTDSQFQGPQSEAPASATRLPQLMPPTLNQDQDPPIQQQGPAAAISAQRAGPGSSFAALRSPSPASSTQPGGTATIDPIYRYLPDTVWSRDAGLAMSPEPYKDALNPTIGSEFVSRPPMSEVGAQQPFALSTPVPYLGSVPRFVSRPPMGGLSVLREEIDKARDSQSFQIEAGLEAGLTPRTLGEPGSLWPTFDAPNPASGEHFWLEPPFPGGFNQLYSPGYQFGSTGGGRYRIHHGIDIGNPVGTPVLAPASGVVIHAGPDNPTLLGPYNDFYGNSVVIRLDRKLNTPRGEEEVFVLYGHLVSVDVQEGQWVGAGDFVGGVGMTGIAIGPHLHMEVRVGQNSYLHTVNPALWTRPAAYAGTVAVRLLSASGRTWPGVQLSLFRYEEGGARWYRVIETYPELENLGPDPAWGENGALGHVSAGNYHISAIVNGEKVGRDITVQAGGTTFVELRTQQ